MTNVDLFGLGDELVAEGAGIATLNAYDQLLVKRGDVNQDGLTNSVDVSALYATFSQSDWQSDLNADGAVSLADVATLVTEVVRTGYGDFNLDRRVDGVDFLTWQRHTGLAGARFDQGDADLNGVIDGADLAILRNAFGAITPFGSAIGSIAVPEPKAFALALLTSMWLTNSMVDWLHRGRVKTP